MWLRTILHKAARAQVIWTTYLLAETDGSHTCKGLPFLAQALRFKPNVAPALRGLRTKALPQLQEVSSGQGSIAGLNATLAGGPGCPLNFQAPLNQVPELAWCSSADL